MPVMKRVLGVDYGERRVGLAVSDELLITAQGLDTFDRKTGDLLGHLERLVEHYDVGRIVLGHPVSMSGRDNVNSRNVEALAATIRDRLRVDVTLWDERLTSEEARRVLRGAGAGKGAVDRGAAVLILQNFLDSRSRPAADPPGGAR
jgi:putative Holliday junction resolvase